MALKLQEWGGVPGMGGVWREFLKSFFAFSQFLMFLRNLWLLWLQIHVLPFLWGSVGTIFGGFGARFTIWGGSESAVSVECSFFIPSFPWTRERDGHFIDLRKKGPVFHGWSQIPARRPPNRACGYKFSLQQPTSAHFDTKLSPRQQ